MNNLRFKNLFCKSNKQTRKDEIECLSEIFSNQFVEFNSNVLAGLCEGTKSIDDAISLLKSLKKLGIHNVVCTYQIKSGESEYTTIQYTKWFDEVKHLAKLTNPINNLNLNLAVEYVLDDYFSNLLENGNINSVQNNKILISIPANAEILKSKSIIHQIIKNGYSPILIHPERNQNFHQNLDHYFDLKSTGCNFQIGLASLNQDNEIQTISYWMLRNKMIDFVRSDLNNPKQLLPLINLTNQTVFHELLLPIIHTPNQLRTI